MANVKVKTNADDLSNLFKRSANIFTAKTIIDWFKNEVNPFVKEETEKSFAKQGRPRWTSLSDAYKEWKKEKYPGKPILEADGDLKRWVTDRRNYELKNNSFSYLFPRLVKDKESKKFVGHQLGEHPKIDLPQRQIVGFQPGDDTKISIMFKNMIERRLRQAGWR